MARLFGMWIGAALAVLPLVSGAEVDDMPPPPAATSFWQDWVLEIIKITPWFAGVLGLVLCVFLHWWVSRRLALGWRGIAPTGWNFWAIPVGGATLTYIAVCAGVLIPGLILDPIFKEHVRQNFDMGTGALWIIPLFAIAWLPMFARLVFPAKGTN